MAENVIAPPGEFCKLILSKRGFQAAFFIDVCTIFAGASVFDRLLHMLPC